MMDNIHNPTAEPAHREALLLDRDGVINTDRTYVARQADFEWRPGIFDLVAVAAQNHVPIVVITNQTGIGRGLYTQEDFDRLTEWMCEVFASRGAPIAKVYHCPYHPEAVVPALRAAHPWRKPEPGMLLAAQRDLGLDLGRSVMVGDQWSDIIAATHAGVGTAVLVGEPRSPAPSPLPAVRRFPDVAAVAHWYRARFAMHSEDARS